jgi:hypothetical protein
MRTLRIFASEMKARTSLEESQDRSVSGSMQHKNIPKYLDSRLALLS